MKKIILITILLLATAECFAIDRDKNTTPQETIHQYCNSWFEADYENMYKLLSKSVSLEIDYINFEQMKVNEMVQIGLPNKCTILDKLTDNGNKSLWSVKISYENKVVGDIVSKNWCEKLGSSWKLSKGGLIGGVLRNPFS